MGVATIQTWVDNPYAPGGIELVTVQDETRYGLAITVANDAEKDMIDLERFWDGTLVVVLSPLTLHVIVDHQLVGPL